MKSLKTLVGATSRLRQSLDNLKQDNILFEQITNIEWLISIKPIQLCRYWELSKLKLKDIIKQRGVGRGVYYVLKWCSAKLSDRMVLNDLTDLVKKGILTKKEKIKGFGSNKGEYFHISWSWEMSVLEEVEKTNF